MHIQSSCGSHSHHPISPSLHIVVCRQLVNPRHRHHQHHHLVLCSDSFCSSSAMMLRRACSASSSSCCCLDHASSSCCRRSNSSRRSDATDLRASDNMAIYYSQMIVSRPTTLSYSRFSPIPVVFSIHLLRKKTFAVKWQRPLQFGRLPARPLTLSKHYLTWQNHRFESNTELQ